MPEAIEYRLRTVLGCKAVGAHLKHEAGHPSPPPPN